MMTPKRKRKIGLSPIVAVAGMFLCLSVARGQGSDGEALPLENLLAPNSAFWQWRAEEFGQHMQRADFRWMEEGVSSRAAPPQGTFFGHRAYEAVVRFQDGTPHSLIAYYFNRGDSQVAMSQEAFQGLVRELSDTITQRLRRQPLPGENRSRSNRVRDDVLMWQFPDHRFELSFSYSPPRREDGRAVPFTAEYIRLSVQKFSTTQLPAHSQTFVNVFDILQNIQRNEAGDVWIGNVPMVDQGPKGYCATATAERVMRYFGQDVDQHQIAQLAGSSAEAGTGSDELRRALESIARQYRYSLNTHISWDFRGFQRMVDQYNRTARQNNGREINLPRSGVVYVDQVYNMFDRDTLVESRVARRTEFNRFEARVRRYVDAGAPLIWGVMLGIVPEPGIPQTAGGHLRLIIGYNLETREILFSDSWGRGHELKRMPIEQAFAITTALYSLEPRGLRL